MDKIFKINGKNYRCVFLNGYDSHYYATVFDDENGRYLGQIVDIRDHDANVERRVAEFVNANA